MCKGLGLDLCEIVRMETLLADERFLSRYFTPEEAAYVHSRGQSAAQTLAGLFAAKEAVVKSLGVGLSLPFKEIEIFHNEAGQPQVRLTGTAAEKLAALGGGDFLLSITHEGGMAAAVALWQA